MSASLATLVTAQEPRTALGQSAVMGIRAAATRPEKTYHVMVRSTDPSLTSISGVPVSKGVGDVMTAIVPETKLAAFVASKEVLRVSAPRMMRPLMDVAAPLVGIPKFVKTNRLSGKGVILGIVDTGIDMAHPAFAGRVLKLWDQEIRGQGPGSGFGKFGTVLSGAAMTASKDLEGHGTHVAGIAGGDGNQFPGVATDADYLIVKTNFQNSAIVEGVRWIFSEATRLDRPCVVNLSLGGHWDSHDGQDDASVAISQECGPGRLVVAAAGNEGTDPIHASQLVDAGHSGRFEVSVKPRTSAEPAPYFVINGWYSGKGRCEVRVISPTGAHSGWQGLIATDPAAQSYAIDHHRVVIATPDSAAPNGDRQFLVEVQADSGPVMGGQWTIEVRRKTGTPGSVHAWLLLDPNRPNSARFLTPVFNNLIGSPGSAEAVITVASYTSRNTWKDLGGDEQQVGLAVSTISDFSSPGPLRDGGLKPDVAAPGAMIASCLSADSAVRQENVIAKQYRMMAGTSMASPMIAGVLALLLEKQPGMTPDEAKAWLKSRSSIPKLAAGTHDTKWGYGLITVK